VKIALFVEGSRTPLPARMKDPLDRIWQEHLPDLLGHQSFAKVVGITKVNLVQLDPRRPKASGNGEALDELIERHLKLDPSIEAAVVAWDLEPPLIEGDACRRRETVAVMRALGASRCLREPWRARAAAWAQRYAAGGPQGAPAATAPLTPCEIRPLCISPEFEALFLDQRRMREALNVTRRQVRGWPKNGWDPGATRRPKQTVSEAVESVRRLSPPPDGLPPIRSPMVDSPNEWGEWLLRRMLQSPEGQAHVRADPMSRRLVDLVPPPTGATTPAR
jgi:hypothetical protein